MQKEHSWSWLLDLLHVDNKNEQGVCDDSAAVE